MQNNSPPPIPPHFKVANMHARESWFKGLNFDSIRAGGPRPKINMADNTMADNIEVGGMGGFDCKAYQDNMLIRLHKSSRGSIFLPPPALGTRVILYYKALNYYSKPGI